MKKITLFTIFACSVFLNTASAQPCPGFPERGAKIIDTFYEQNIMLAHGDDDQRRTLTRIIAEQMRFEFGAWSVKSAGPGRPQSKDSLALPQGDSGAFCNWDWQNGTTRKRAVEPGMVGDFIADQILLPTEAVNRLGNTPAPLPTPVPSPVPQPSPVDLSGVLKMLDALAKGQDVQREQLERVFANLTAQHDEAKQLDAAHDERLRVHAEQTKSFMDRVGSFFTNGKTLAVIAGLVAGRFALPQ